MKETTKKHVNAKVVLCKCSQKHGGESPSNLFGIRIEEQDGDWVRTWAFKIDEDRAKREGFDETQTRGTMHPSA